MKVRCERCGERFPADPPRTASGEVYAEKAVRPGIRNESSVLFSLAPLAKQMPAPAPAAKVTESSALIDLRALVAASATHDPSRSNAAGIVNLGGTSSFAPLFAAPLAPPVTFVLIGILTA